MVSPRDHVSGRAGVCACGCEAGRVAGRQGNAPVVGQVPCVCEAGRQRDAPVVRQVAVWAFA